MILLIFGAGASYDSVPHHQPKTHPDDRRPPLADELFDLRFARFLADWGEAQKIAPYLRVRKDDRSVEQVLDGLAIEAESSARRRRQLGAMCFYLSSVIHDIERGWVPNVGWPTNYETLLDEIIETTTEDVAIVTFNYDDLIEDALGRVGNSIQSLPSYVEERRFRLFKVHGSTNWARDPGVDVDAGGRRSNLEVGQELVHGVDDWKLGEFNFVGAVPSLLSRIPHQPPVGSLELKAVVPAISVPLTTKPEFEMPADHLEVLDNLLRVTTRVLSIGWRAGDRPFLELLAKRVPANLSWLVVTNSHAGDVIERMQAGTRKSGRYRGWDGGFTNFVTDRGFGAWIRGELDETPWSADVSLPGAPGSGAAGSVLPPADETSDQETS